MRKKKFNIQTLLAVLVYFVVVAIGLHFLLDSLRSKRHHQAYLMLFARAQQIIQMVSEDLVGGLIYLQACGLDSVVRQGGEEGVRVLRILSTNNDLVTPIRLHRGGLSRYIDTWDDSSFEPGADVIVCGQGRKREAVVKSIASSRQSGLKRLALREALGAKLADDVPIMARFDEHEYVVQMVNGRSTLLKRNDQGKKQIIAEGVHDLRVYFRYSDGSKALTYEKEKDLSAVEINLVLEPKGKAQTKLFSTNGGGIQFAYVLPFEKLPLISYPHRLLVKSADQVNTLDTLVWTNEIR